MAAVVSFQVYRHRAAECVVRRPASMCHRRRHSALEISVHHSAGYRRWETTTPHCRLVLFAMRYKFLHPKPLVRNLIDTIPLSQWIKERLMLDFFSQTTRNEQTEGQGRAIASFQVLRLKRRKFLVWSKPYLLDDHCLPGIHGRSRSVGRNV